VLIGPDSVAIRSIGMSVVRSGFRSILLHLGHGFEAGEAADKYCNTALDHAPQCKPRDLRMDALGVGDYYASDGDSNDEHAQTHHG